MNSKFLLPINKNNLQNWLHPSTDSWQLQHCVTSQQMCRDL